MTSPAPATDVPSRPSLWAPSKNHCSADVEESKNAGPPWKAQIAPWSLPASFHIGAPTAKSA